MPTIRENSTGDDTTAPATSASTKPSWPVRFTAIAPTPRFFTTGNHIHPIAQQVPWDGTDKINDFVSQEDKLLVLKVDRAKKGTVDPDNFVWGKKAKDSNDYYLYDRKTGKFYIDTDGSSGGNSKLVAVLEDHHKLKYSDIVVHKYLASWDYYWDDV